MVKSVTVKLVIDSRSMTQFENMLKKFQITWNKDVFKAVDGLGKNIDRLTDKVYNLTLITAKLRDTIVNNSTPSNPATGVPPTLNLQKLEESIDDLDKFFKDLGSSTEDFTDSMKNAADQISKLDVKVSASTGATGEETEKRWESINAMQLAEGQRKKMMQKERYALREEADLRDHRLKQERLMTRSMMSGLGGGFGGILGTMIQKAGDSMRGNFGKANATEEYLKTQEGQDSLAWWKSDPNMRDPAYQGIGQKWKDKGVSFGTMEESGTRTGAAKRWMGNRIEGAMTGDMSKMFGGKMGMVAAGGALGGIMLMKKAISLGIESSPMMQQMLKLWKFGIMMIFRPIGDFFGFFLRPIFVQLLRQFIIPFYQEYLPMMQTMGHDLGTLLAGFLKAFPIAQGATTLDVTGEMATENMTLRNELINSMGKNEDYWLKFFEENGAVPDWVQSILNGMGALPEQATPENVPIPSMTQGGGYVDPDKSAAALESTVEAATESIDIVTAPYKKLLDDLTEGGSGSGQFVTQGGMLGNSSGNSSGFDLTTNEGLLAAQQASSGSTNNWSINMYTNISGAGTEEVNEKIEQEIEKLPDKITPIIEEKVNAKYGRVNPRGG